MTLLACAACAADPDSPMTKAAFWGVLVLLGVIVPVMGGFGGLFLFWMRRARRLERELAARPVVPVSGDEPSVDEAPVWRTESGPQPPDSPGPTLH